MRTFEWLKARGVTASLDSSTRQQGIPHNSRYLNAKPLYGQRGAGPQYRQCVSEVHMPLYAIVSLSLR